MPPLYTASPATEVQNGVRCRDGGSQHETTNIHSNVIGAVVAQDVSRKTLMLEHQVPKYAHRCVHSEAQEHGQGEGDAEALDGSSL